MTKIETYKMPSQHTSDYGLGVRCRYTEMTEEKELGKLCCISLVGLIEFPDNPDFTPQPAPAYVVCFYDEQKTIYYLADEYYIFGILKPFTDPDQAIDHLKSICV